MNNRVWILSAAFLLLCVVLVWRLSGSDSGHPEGLNEKKLRTLSEAERNRLEELQKIDPLADSNTYIRTLDQLSLVSVRQSLGTLSSRPQKEKQQVYSTVLRNSKKPMVREVAILMMRKAGEP